MSERGVEEEGDWMWEKDEERERRGQQMPAGVLLMFVFAGLGWACLALSCLALAWLWWTEVVVVLAGWLAVAGQRKVRGAEVHRCREGILDVTCARAGAQSLQLLAAARATTSILPPNSNSELHDNKTSLYLLDNSGDI
jgi:hypothetical protein